VRKFRSIAFKIVIHGCFFYLLSWQLAHAEDMPRGLILEKVTCLHDAGQSYVLFLPSAYQSDRSWPIVYCFDPGGRGVIPVALFKNAAEKYGYILVGSSNSKNGLWISILQAAQAFWRDTHARLAIDDRRIYAAGFSGGARAACGLGKMLSIKLSGVITCGAGLAEWLMPSDLSGVPWYGIAGLYDFNFGEMQQLASQLHALGIPRHLEIFIGKHQWPPADLCLQAFDWLELQAMKADLRPRNDSLINLWLTQKGQKALDLENQGKIAEAYIIYTGLVDDFSGLTNVSPYETSVNALKDSQPVKNYFKNEQELAGQSEATINRIQTIYSQLQGQFQEPGIVRKKIAELKLAAFKRDAAAKEIDNDQIVATRVLIRLLGKVVEDGNNYLQMKDGPRAVITWQIAAEVKPDHPGILYALACARALNNEKKKALKTLGEAIAFGFDDLQALADDKEWDSLRSQPDFIKLVATLSSKEAVHDEIR
jgi:predicted esterase